MWRSITSKLTGKSSAATGAGTSDGGDAAGLASIQSVLEGIIDPKTGLSITGSEVLSAPQLADGRVFLTLSVATDDVETFTPIREVIERSLLALPEVDQAFVVLSSEAPAQRVVKSPAPATIATPKQAAEAAPPPKQNRHMGGIDFDGVGAVLAVASGKGGVGKSTTTANLAIALHQQGLKVGVLDADVYGPSIPRLFGVSAPPQFSDNKKATPPTAHGIKVMSMGFLVEEGTPMVWRAPMVVSALRQMLTDVLWAPLDVLLIDMPPGTGDTQLTISQQVPLDGAVIVSTPQDLALIDARKGVAMFEKVHVPVLGVLENMSTYICPACGHEEHIFGHGGAGSDAERLGVPFLGEVPLDITIRQTSDAGTPIATQEPDGPHARVYSGVAERLWRDVEARRLGQRQPPAIVVEDDQVA